MTQWARRRVCCFTSFTYSYLPRAQILAESVRAVHPEWELRALVVDKPPPGFDAASALRAFDTVTEASSLAIPRFEAWLFKHDLVEACTAVKGQMLLELLAEGFDVVVYLDPDIALFNPLHGILNQLGSASIVLTPHQVEPNTGVMAQSDNEWTSSRYGVYNLGFLAVRNDASGQAFAAWWAEQLQRACYDDPHAGIFTDQKYCDLVPGLFEGVYIERDPGCNVASWNLSRRTLCFNRGDLLVNGSLLKFYHFTKIGTEGDLMTKRYADGSSEVIEVWTWYKRKLRAFTKSLAPDCGWAYSVFDNGKRIEKQVRVFYRGRPDLLEAYADPFTVAGDSLYNWLKHEEPALLATNG